MSPGKVKKPPPKLRKLGGRWVRGVIWVGSVALLTVLSPLPRSHEFSDLKPGMVSDREILAPFTFFVRKTKEELKRDREKARSAVPPLLRYHRDVGGKELKRLEDFWKLAARARRDSAALLSLRDYPLQEETLRKLVLTSRRPRTWRRFVRACTEVLRDFYGRGFLEDKSKVPPCSTGKVIIAYEGGEREVPLEDIWDLKGLRERLLSELRARLPSEDLALLGYEVLTAFLSPNLSLDEVETERRREEAAGKVGIYKRLIPKGYRIIGKHELVTEEHIEILRSLAQEKMKRSMELGAWPRVRTMASWAVLNSAFYFLVMGYLLLFRRNIFRRNGNILLLSILFLVPAGTASYLRTMPEPFFLLLPLPLSSMLATVLFDVGVGFVMTASGALLSGQFLGNLGMAVLSVLAGTVAVASVRQVRHRRQFYGALGVLPSVYIIGVPVLSSVHLLEMGPLGKAMTLGALSGISFPVLTIGLLPIFETLFGITTNITLVELSDLNHPLLRELAVRAPGTYNHTIIVSILAETAAEAVGANSLLARVGAYYHDIGKMRKPEYFIENQMGTPNPHDRLSPTMSALILAAHVKDGLELAREHGLPKAVQDFIPQHHGTSIMEYFYDKAKKQMGDVSEANFRYPGPIPQNKEAAIVMLADSVESAVRSLGERTPARVRGMIREVTRKKLEDGQLDGSDLTLRDLRRIEESFLPVLMGVFHPRVAYPERREGAGVRVGDGGTQG